MTSHEIGPYRFEEIDLRRTVRHALDIVDHHRPDAQPALAERRTRLADLVAGHDPDTDTPETLVPVVDAVWPELLGSRDDLAAAGLLPATQTGRVDALALGSGGVPKSTTDRVEVDHGGVVGDVQAARRHHGSPWQALCLWSADVIDGLVADGHPVFAGAAGENVTISGIEWATVVPGARLRLGSVLCEVVSFAVPCRKNAQWFSDRRFDRLHHDKGDLSRLYAAVIEPGEIALGDAAILEPTSR